MAVKVSMVALGCSKNQIDGEMMLASLQKAGYKLVREPGESDVVLVNTCGFIQSAKEEAIENILELVTLKQEGTIKAILVTGCLAERYREEILTEIPEVDAVVGIGSNGNICEIVAEVLQGKQVSRFGVKEDLPMDGERILTTLPYYAYLKVAEGCDNCCSYCAIPAIRGRFRSRPIESLVEEAKWLAKQGVRELILIAQDTTRYGEDLYGTYSLPKLLRALLEIESFRWIRILYCYPDKITDELLTLMRDEPRIARYLDIPLQHCSGQVLRRMNRPMDRDSITDLIAHIRETVPGITLRTTLITGFPGETEEQFAELSEFVQETRFDRLGCFRYSPEEGTVAADLPDQIPEEIKEKREEIIMEQQATIMAEENEKKIGKKLLVVVEGFDRYGECYIGRSEADAPEIDGNIFFTSDRQLTMGEFVKVKITDVLDYDLIGECLY